MKNPELGTIYIEGTDFTGKDTVGKFIAGEYGVTNIQKLSLHPNNPWDADKTGEIPPDSPLFPAYLARSIIWDIQHFPIDTKKRQLQLSFTATRSAAWCHVSGDKFGDVFKELLKFSPIFEHSFLLSASIPIKQARLKMRQTEGGAVSLTDKLVFSNPDFVTKVDEILEKISCQEMGAKVVKTDELTIGEVGSILIASIDEQTVSISNNDTRLIQADISPELFRFHKEIISYADSIAKKYSLSGTIIEKVKQPI
ncbi:MAG: hypothetical protein PHR98_01405 [Candidatus Shapirobacteria bacterium]|jgi:hypothetical protein|nr:hypothetical protein [Candidatus Shapirobacteria bacterium]